MADQPIVSLNNGVEIPQLGFGVFKVPPGQTAEVVAQALATGYRHIDTAAMYGNEEGVGRAIAESDLPRDQIFVTTKLNNDAHGTDEALYAFESSRERLGLDVVDLYLIHWPLPAQDRYVETWQALERCCADGKVRAMGVSNFQLAHLRRLAEETATVPALNQIELHPHFTQAALREYDVGHGIATEAWSPLGQGRRAARRLPSRSLAEKYDHTPAQVVLRWHLQLGNVVIPKTVTPERIAENFAVFDFELDSDDVEAISGLDRDRRTGPDPRRRPESAAARRSRSESRPKTARASSIASTIWPSMSVISKSFGVNTRATPGLTHRGHVRFRDDPAEHDRHVVEAGLAQAVDHVRHRGQVRAGKDRQPDDVYVLLDRGVDDLARREPDAGVDDLEAGVSGPHRDLLGTVGVAVQAGLADQELQRPAQLLPEGVHPLAHLGQASLVAATARRGDAGRRAVFAEHLAQHPGPLPDGGTDPRARERRLHQVLLGLGRVTQRVQRLLDGSRVAAGPPLRRRRPWPMTPRPGRR